MHETPNVLLRHNRLMMMREEKLRKAWPSKWSFFLEEQERLKEAIDTAFKAEEEVFDKSSKPIPLTTNGQYGWLTSKPAFQLENVSLEQWYYNKLRRVDQQVLNEFY